MNIYLIATLVGDTVLGGEQFLKRGYSQAFVEVVYFFKIFINVERGEGEGGLARSWS